jgi:hypothetical protein
LQFDLPAVPQVSAPWNGNGVTWRNQPATTGAAVTTTSGSGWRERNVAPNVRSIYDSGLKYDFLICDASDSISQ